LTRFLYRQSRHAAPPRQIEAISLECIYLISWLKRALRVDPTKVPRRKVSFARTQALTCRFGVCSVFVGFSFDAVGWSSISLTSRSRWSPPLHLWIQYFGVFYSNTPLTKSTRPHLRAAILSQNEAATSCMRLDSIRTMSFSFRNPTCVFSLDHYRIKYPAAVFSRRLLFFPPVPGHQNVPCAGQIANGCAKSPFLSVP
jgi:hypothetical protein